MKIAYNPKDAVVVTATTAANNDILFDLYDGKMESISLVRELKGDNNE